ISKTPYRIDNLIWSLANVCSKASKTKSTAPDSGKECQKTQHSNLIRYVPSGTYFARLRVRGKLIRKSLKTDVLTVAKLRLADFEKNERQRAESQIDVAHGKLTFGEALAIYHQRILGDVSLKQRTKEYYEERSEALLKSWPGLKTTGIAKISKSEC